MYRIIKIVLFIIVGFVLLNSLFFVGMSVYKSIHAYILLAHGEMDERPGIIIAESLDGFMIALFFLIFSMGIARLFLPKSEFIKGYELPWLKIEDFSQLKLILWEVLLTTLFVFFAARILIVENNLDWNILIIPASVLMLSIAYKLLKQSH